MNSLLLKYARPTSNATSTRTVAKAVAAAIMCLALALFLFPALNAQSAHAVTAKPDKVEVKSLAPYSATSFTVKWHKVSGAKGYQVRYSVKSDMSKATLLTSKSAKTTSYRAKDLQVHKKYYVQVRAYKLSKNGTMVKGKWSAKQSVYTNYSISYMLNGGKQAEGQRYSYNKESGAIKLLSPKQTGYLFLGWYTNPSFVGKKVTSIPAGSTGNKYFYARWVSKTAPAPEFIFKWCSSKGMTKTCAAAIVGNAQQESGCNPEAYNKGGKSYGLFQWTGKRYQRLKEIAESKGRTWKDLECQLILLMEELTDTSNKGCFYQFTGYTGKYSNGTKWGWKDELTYEEWSSWTNIEKATTAFEQIFERASIPRMEKRIAYAKSAYEAYK